MNNTEKGFTLVELMVVISIIGILSAIAIPAYQDYITRTQLAESLDLVGAVKGGILESYSTTGICPNNSDSTKFGIAKANDISGRYVSSVIASGIAPDCYIEVTFKSNDIAKPLESKKMKFDLNITSGSYRWDCYSNDIELQYLPNGCR